MSRHSIEPCPRSKGPRHRCLATLQMSCGRTLVSSKALRRPTEFCCALGRSASPRPPASPACWPASHTATVRRL